MPLVTGPLHSDTASGSFAKALTFRETRGRKICRAYARPSNPKSQKQNAVRIFTRNLQQTFQYLPPEWKALWQTIADANQTSAINEYCRLNWQRWMEGKGKTDQWPPPEIALPNDLPFTEITADGPRVTIDPTNDGDAQDAGIAVFRKATDNTNFDRAALIGFCPNWPGGHGIFVDTLTDPGSYYYTLVALCNDGARGDPTHLTEIVYTL